MDSNTARLSCAVICVSLVVACGDRPSGGWASYSFERQTDAPSAWTAPGGPIWMNNGFIFRIDGDTVEQDKQASEAGGDEYHFYSLYGTAADDVWIDCTLHYDGVRWQKYIPPSDSPGGGCAVTGVYGADRDRYIYVHPMYRTHSIEWDGKQWQLRDLPRAESEWASAFAVHGTGRADIHVVGADGYLAHYDGSDWRLLETPLPVYLEAVWARSPVEAYAAGSRPPIDDTLTYPADGGVLLRWDGSIWRQITSPTTTPVEYLSGFGDVLYLATASKVFERDAQGRWTEIFEVEPNWRIHHMTAETGLLMICTRGPLTPGGIKLWLR